MIKLIIVFLLSFLIIQNVLSQQLLSPDILRTLEDRIHPDGVLIGESYSRGQARLLKNNLIIYPINYSHLFTPGATLETFYEDILGGDYFKLSLRDTNMTIVNEWYTSEYNSDSIKAYEALMIEEKEDHIVVVGNGINNSLDTTKRHLFEFTFDKNLILEDQKWVSIPLNLDEGRGLADIIINHRGNYVFTGLAINPDNDLPENKEKYICELSGAGEIINYHAPLQRRQAFSIDGALLQMNNGYYVVHPFHILDTLFNEVAQYQGHDYQLTPRIVEITNDRFVFSGTKVQITTPPNIQQVDLEVLAVGDLNGNWSNIFLNDLNNSFNTAPGLRSIDTRDTNCIYFATMRGLFIFAETNFVDIYNVDLNGSINWGYTFGGDATYFPYNVVALPNEKCLLIVNKLDHCPEGLKGDIEYVIFDKNGDVVNLSTGLDKKLLQRISVSIYPNPANQEFTIEVDDSFSADQLKSELFTLSGRLVMSQIIGTKELIDVQVLPSGVYAIVIYKNNEPFYSIKVVIEH